MRSARREFTRHGHPEEAGNPLKPSRRPLRPEFSSGPCAKRPGWSLGSLDEALVGRSHRSGGAVTRLAEVIDRSRNLLGIPDEYHLGVVPGGDTGAFESALWSLLGSRGTDLLAWDSFGKGWITDVDQHLALPDTRVFEADYGTLPDLAAVDCDRDVVFTFNGTTAGVRVPDTAWIASDRAGLTLCDATSAVFAMEMDWRKLDVVTWSWQKSLGGEGAHGMLALSPRAVERLLSDPSPHPLPKLFRLTAKGHLAKGIFRGETINTPSMLCVEDALDGLRWAESIGGLPELVERSKRNLETVAEWVSSSSWADFLARDPRTRSSTSICLAFRAEAVADFDQASRQTLANQITARLADEGVAYDIGAYRDAPAGLRLWGGPTVENSDLVAVLPWLDWAFSELASG